MPVSTSLGYQHDFCVVTVRAAQLAVAREQRQVERFGKRHIGGVIGRYGLSQFPNSRQQQKMPMALDLQLWKGVDGNTRILRGQLPFLNESAQRIHNFNIDKMRRV